jgi:hypothetical protein
VAELINHPSLFQTFRRDLPHSLRDLKYYGKPDTAESLQPLRRLLVELKILLHLAGGPDLPELESCFRQAAAAAEAAGNTLLYALLDVTCYQLQHLEGQAAMDTLRADFGELVDRIVLRHDALTLSEAAETGECAPL